MTKRSNLIAPFYYDFYILNIRTDKKIITKVNPTNNNAKT